MASIKKRGKSYLFIVSCGYDRNHKKLTESMTWTPPPGMKEAKADKEAERQAEIFEQKVKNGHYLDGEKVTFAEFVDIWLRDYAEQQLKPSTVNWYRQMLGGRVVPAIGHITLSKLQPSHLIKLRKSLQESDMNQEFKYHAKPDIRKVWKASGAKYSDGIKRHTLTAILAGDNVNPSTAKLFSGIVKKNVDDLFDQVGEAKPLSSNTVRHYLRCVSSVLSVAVEWQLIESNPCSRVRPPKVEQKAIKYLEIDEAQRIIEAAMKIDDIRIQTAVMVFLYTGVRKGELVGLRWSDIDLDNQSVTIRRALQSIPGQGLVMSDPKTDSGERMVSLSDGLIDQLRRYKKWQQQERMKVGDRWQGKDFERAKEEGREWQPVDWVFTGLDGYPLHPSTVYHKIKAFLTDNGHPEMTVHGLRHSNISLLLSQGVDLITAARRAGHAKPSTTANIYAHALKKPDEAAADKLDELFNANHTSGEL